MTQPFSGFQVGGVVQPLSTSSGNSLLRDADPAVFFALEFFAFIIATYPGPRLVQAAGAAGVTQVTSAVAQKYPNLPQPEFLETQFQFPLLCVARKRTLFGRLTAGHERRRGLFDLLYVLPPLSPAQVEQVLPILHAIEEALGTKTTQGFDPGYTPSGGAAGQSPWGLAFAGVQDVGFGDPYRDLTECTEYGFLEGTGNLLFPSIRMSGYISERDNYNAVAVGAGKFTGGDVTADLAAGDGTTIDPFVQVSTQVAPTVTSLSVATGSHAGGTSTVFTGTGFVAGSAVQFGSTYSTSVTWNSATSLTVLSPAVSGASATALSVTVTNPYPDGQRGTLPLAFLYT